MIQTDLQPTKIWPRLWPPMVIALILTVIATITYLEVEDHKTREAHVAAVCDSVAGRDYEGCRKRELFKKAWRR